MPRPTRWPQWQRARHVGAAFEVSVGNGSGRNLAPEGFNVVSLRASCPADWVMTAVPDLRSYRHRLGTYNRTKLVRQCIRSEHVHRHAEKLKQFMPDCTDVATYLAV